MNITIKKDNQRFGVRAGAIILNKNCDKVLIQKQKKMDCYVFPGGRVQLTEDPDYAIERELEEELGIKDEKYYLKYIVESFIDKDVFYHEIGFYYILKIDENKYQLDINKKHCSKDLNEGESFFEWVSIDKLNNYQLLLECLIKEIENKEFSSRMKYIKYKK